LKIYDKFKVFANKNYNIVNGARKQAQLRKVHVKPIQKVSQKANPIL
jgi:hypothetical protein